GMRHPRCLTSHRDSPRNTPPTGSADYGGTACHRAWRRCPNRSPTPLNPAPTDGRRLADTSPPMRAPIRRVRVLCVDDNRDSAETMALLLGLLGFDARACYDGRTALEVAAEFQPDVCLLDINMPVMDGNELAGRLRDRYGGRPLLLVAAT